MVPFKELLIYLPIVSIFIYMICKAVDIMLWLRSKIREKLGDGAIVKPKNNFKNTMIKELKLLGLITLFFLFIRIASDIRTITEIDTMLFNILSTLHQKSSFLPMVSFESIKGLFILLTSMCFFILIYFLNNRFRKKKQKKEKIIAKSSVRKRLSSWNLIVFLVLVTMSMLSLLFSIMTVVTRTVINMLPTMTDNLGINTLSLYNAAWMFILFLFLFVIACIVEGVYTKDIQAYKR